METELLIGGYLLIAIVVIFGITILIKVIKKKEFTASDTARSAIIFGIGFLYIIALAFYYSEKIGLSDRLQILLMFGLVAVTISYAWSASKQANANMKMAEEMKEQRYDALRPIIDIWVQLDATDLIEQGFNALKGKFPENLPCRLRNIGVGPAIELYSFIEGPEGKSRRRDFDAIPVAIGEEEMGYTREMRLPLEQRDDHRALVVYYKDVYGNLFESSREVSVEKGKKMVNIGPLKVHPLRKKEHSSD